MIEKQKNKYNSSGITLIALVITIIIILILAAISMKMLLGDNGIITNALKASFFQEMAPINEQKEMSKVKNFMQKGQAQNIDNNFLAENVSVEEVKKFSNTLKAEIIFARNSFGTNTYTGKGDIITTEQIWKNDMYETQTLYNNEDEVLGISVDLFYISEEASGKVQKYLYDRVTDICFKIPDTIVHSVEYARFILDGVNSTGIGIIDTETGVITSSDGTKCYEPDLNNFSYKTEIVYYSPDLQEQQTLNIKEFISQDKPATMNVNGVTYTFANYSAENKIWANVKTTANGLEGYWTWIPRYAYKLESGTVRMEINGGPAWTNINVSQSYAECESLNSATSTLGTSALQAHLTTDADWSAMAIFAVSQYGGATSNGPKTTNGNNSGIFDVGTGIVQTTGILNTADANSTEYISGLFESDGKTPKKYVKQWSPNREETGFVGFITEGTYGWLGSWRDHNDNTAFPLTMKQGLFGTHCGQISPYLASGVPSERATFRPVIWN